MIMKKMYFLYIIIGIYCLLLVISGKIWFMAIYVSMIFIAKFYSVKRNKELDYMWQLVSEKNISLAILSELSTIGQLDLKATQREESGRYLPPRKIVKQTINKLESYRA